MTWNRCVTNFPVDIPVPPAALGSLEAEFSPLSRAHPPCPLHLRKVPQIHLPSDLVPGTQSRSSGGGHGQAPVLTHTCGPALVKGTAPVPAPWSPRPPGASGSKQGADGAGPLRPPRTGDLVSRAGAPARGRVSITRTVSRPHLRGRQRSVRSDRGAAPPPNRAQMLQNFPDPRARGQRRSRALPWAPWICNEPRGLAGSQRHPLAGRGFWLREALGAAPRSANAPSTSPTPQPPRAASLPRAGPAAAQVCGGYTGSGPEPLGAGRRRPRGDGAAPAPAPKRPVAGARGCGGHAHREDRRGTGPCATSREPRTPRPRREARGD